MLRHVATFLIFSAAGCSTTPLGQPDMQGPLPPLGRVITVTATGSVTGTFPALLRVIYNQPGAPQITSFGVVTAQSPGLGIASFAINASLAGQPEPRHYNEREAQMVASLKMAGGQVLSSTIDSMNSLDLATTGDAITEDDGSQLFQPSGSATGTVVSLDTPDTVHFHADF